MILIHVFWYPYYAFLLSIYLRTQTVGHRVCTASILVDGAKLFSKIVNTNLYIHQQYLQDMNILIVPYSYKYLVFSIIFILAILDIVESCYDFYFTSNEVIYL